MARRKFRFARPTLRAVSSPVANALSVATIRLEVSTRGSDFAGFKFRARRRPSETVAAAKATYAATRFNEIHAYTRSTKEAPKNHVRLPFSTIAVTTLMMSNALIQAPDRRSQRMAVRNATRKAAYCCAETKLEKREGWSIPSNPYTAPPK